MFVNIILRTVFQHIWLYFLPIRPLADSEGESESQGGDKGAVHSRNCLANEPVAGRDDEVDFPSRNTFISNHTGASTIPQ